MLAVGTVVALVSDLAPWIATYGVTPEDLRQQDPEFYQQFGFLPQDILSGELSPTNTPIVIIPWIILSQKKDSYLVMKADSGQKKTVKHSEVVAGDWEISGNTKLAWTPCSFYGWGEPTTPPLVPLFDGSPSCVYYQNNWVGLQHRTTETALTPSTRRADKPKLSTYMFYPRLRWKDVASTAELVLGTPWLNPSNGKVAKSKIGAGFVVSVDSTPAYYSSWKNTGSDSVEPFSTNNKYYYYVPINQLTLTFRFAKKEATKNWFCINWCLSGFQHLFNLFPQNLNSGSNIT